MANQRLTKKKLKNHLAYSWWKYALAAAVSTMLVSIVFAVTEYRPPDDKKVEFYVLNSYADTETMQADFWPLLQAWKPEQEKLTVININLTDSSNIYAPMQFSTYVAAQQGDLFLISRDEMLKITSDGAQESLVGLTLTGLNAYGNDPRDSLLCIPMYSKNADSAAALIELMLEKLR